MKKYLTPCLSIKDSIIDEGIADTYLPATGSDWLDKGFEEEDF